MAAVPGLRNLLTFHRSLKLQCRSVLIPSFSYENPVRKLCSSSEKNVEPQPQSPQNESLLENLNLMGVDVRMARQRQPGVFRKSFTNERDVAQFLQGKGASLSEIAGIISRYPRAITRSIEHLEQRWELWKNIFETDEEIVRILDRSPESFFRSSDNGNLEKNLAFLSTLGLTSKDLHRLLATAPRTFSNSVKLNKLMVELLEDICAELGGTNPEQFAKDIICRNLYVLIRSTKRVRANVDLIKAYVTLSDEEVLALLQGRWACILDLSNECMRRNLNNLHQMMASLGFQKADVENLIISYPKILYIGPDTLNSKMESLLKGGITMQQILEKPKVLDYSEKTLTARLMQLTSMGYDFQRMGISILDMSKKRFDAKMKKNLLDCYDE
ncbi:transcription termination factor 1, mitochondrial [Halichoeres trimaculatus]|uniref:transcription termination factor 1, mitochondrial n=1 Tax=Halichoeres trimaculatus TaxID=147232 RepID=UPI003D9F25DC